TLGGHLGLKLAPALNGFRLITNDVDPANLDHALRLRAERVEELVAERFAERDAGKRLGLTAETNRERVDNLSHGRCRPEHVVLPHVGPDRLDLLFDAAGR